LTAKAWVVVASGFLPFWIEEQVAAVESERGEGQYVHVERKSEARIDVSDPACILVVPAEAADEVAGAYAADAVAVATAVAAAAAVGEAGEADGVAGLAGAEDAVDVEGVDVGVRVEGVHTVGTVVVAAVAVG
jgi:hypothetical protein